MTLAAKPQGKIRGWNASPALRLVFWRLVSFCNTPRRTDICTLCRSKTSTTSTSPDSYALVIRFCKVHFRRSWVGFMSRLPASAVTWVPKTVKETQALRLKRRKKVRRTGTQIDRKHPKIAPKIIERKLYAGWGLKMSGSLFSLLPGFFWSVKISIKEATGLPPAFANFVFCQYTFWGERDPVVVPYMATRSQQATKTKDGAKLRFNFSRVRCNCCYQGIFRFEVLYPSGSWSAFNRRVFGVLPRWFLVDSSLGAQTCGYRCRMGSAQIGLQKQNNCWSVSSLGTWFQENFVGKH